MLGLIIFILWHPPYYPHTHTHTYILINHTHKHTHCTSPCQVPQVVLFYLSSVTKCCIDKVSSRCHQACCYWFTLPTIIDLTRYVLIRLISLMCFKSSQTSGSLSWEMLCARACVCVCVCVTEWLFPRNRHSFNADMAHLRIIILNNFNSRT